MLAEGRVLGPGEGKRIDLPSGAAIIFKAWGEREAGNFDLAEFVAEPGVPGPRPHIHRTHEELFYVLTGQFDFLVGEEVVRVGERSLVHVPPGVIHDFRNAGSTQARCLIIPSPRGLDRYFEEKGRLASSGTADESAIAALRLKYDIDEVDVAWKSPPNSGAAGGDRASVL